MLLQDCNGRGFCLPVKMLAENAGVTYTTPWDADKLWGCLCDYGWRGPSCELQECLSFDDPFGGFGNEQLRDCSGMNVIFTLTLYCITIIYFRPRYLQL